MMNDLQISSVVANILMGSLEKFNIERDEFNELYREHFGNKQKYSSVSFLNEYFAKLRKSYSDEEIVRIIAIEGIHSEDIALFKNLVFSFISHKNLYRFQSRLVLPYLYKGIKLKVEFRDRKIILEQINETQERIDPIFFKVYLEVYRNFPVIIGRKSAVILFEEITSNSLKEKSVLVRAMGHDVNNSIYASQLLCQRLEKKLENTKELELVKKLTNHINIIQTISANTLKNEMDEDHILNEYSYEKVSAIVHELEEIYQEQLTRKQIQVNFKIDVEEEIIQINKSVFLYNILCNYFFNAIKYSSVYSEIDVEVKQVGDCFSFSIIDYGKGMNVETVQQIEGTLGEKGYGQGMIIAKNLLAKMYGEVKVLSEVGKGTTITCVVPRLLSKSSISGVSLNH
ncbi:sensor histidine kinase [Halobacteriovorax sp. YZS-3-2]|uniref:sensor histidine kinase n=1 Tax=Halobacteriovorax sp. YZS-3-2 TaxID=3391180 RepID=UPI003999BBC6